MPQLMTPPPYTPVEPVTEVLHGVSVTDPYRWLEDQDSPRTRAWIEEQNRYTQAYLAGITNRERVRQPITQLLDVETYDSLQKAGTRYFFRKRRVSEEQFCICMRESAGGEDVILVDPLSFGAGSYTAVRILCTSLDGSLVAYEVRQGGEDSQCVEIFDVDRRATLIDRLPHGVVSSFVFAPDNKSFYYVHESTGSGRRNYRAAVQHVIGCNPDTDREVFFAGEDPDLQLGVQVDMSRLGFVAIHFGDQVTTDLFIQDSEISEVPILVAENIGGRFGPVLSGGCIIALTDHNCPNGRIVEIVPTDSERMTWKELVPEQDARIATFAVTSKRIFVSYVQSSHTSIVIYDFLGNELNTIRFPEGETVRIIPGTRGSDEFYYELQSFTRPPSIYRYLPDTDEYLPWTRRISPFASGQCKSARVSYTSRDGTEIPMSLVGLKNTLEQNMPRPTLLTGYGGFGVSMTPQFSILVSFMMERGCLFALPNLRGGSEFGAQWHLAAKRRNRQNAFDDFIRAAEYLIDNGYTVSDKLAIFGGSNSGLLVGAALTQRPDLFRAVLCIAPLLDMLRYHLFDFSRYWKEEYGSSEDVDDFKALSSYSPYHRVQDNAAYPAVLMISGDADTRCNPLHARKMIARLQAANSSTNPILLQYTRFRGHTPVLPLTERIDALTDRLCFLCDQLGIST
jgi:prolyl oligopeptidase